MRKIFLWILMTMTMYQLIVTPSWWPNQTIVMSLLTKARRCWWVSWMALFFYRPTNQSTLHDKVAAWSIQKVKSVWKHFLYADQSNFPFTDRTTIKSFSKTDRWYIGRNWTLPLGLFRTNFTNFPIGWDRTSAYIRRYQAAAISPFLISPDPYMERYVSFDKARGYSNNWPPHVYGPLKLPIPL